MKQQPIELLAPARNLACGLAAVEHGADAVYIGAPRFGARAAATNTADDIGRLVEYAHRFGVKIYVTLNTILRDDELPLATQLTWQLYRLGVDALIVQDMSLLRLPLPPIPLHASTQMDNRSLQKVQFLAQAGFRQVVLARELPLQQIRTIHQACPQLKLEVFVHGALCVSYSGQCYASQACFGRSANRGECAQFCRLPFTLVDADGRVVSRDKHLLSLRDMNRLERLEELLDAGVTSLKIEGRLKELSYVKNITAAYRRKLDELFARRPEYCAAAWGHVSTTFTPQPDKSFSRGFTTYYLDGRRPEDEVASMDTPKSMGEPMGTLKQQRQGTLTVAGVKPFHNGDGACYLDEHGKMQGFRINRVENGRLYPAAPLPPIKPRTPLFRNFDQEFEAQLARPSAERKINLSWSLWDLPTGFVLQATDETGRRAALRFEAPKQRANTPQAEPIRRQLTRLGDTPFQAQEPIHISLTEPWFIPSSQLADWRRRVLQALERAHRVTYPRELQRIRPTTHPWPSTTLTYAGNVMNREARLFYQSHGVTQIAPAFEQQPAADALLMRCKHCLRYSFGWCPTRQQGRSPYREPYYLQSNDGRRFRLQFDCKACEMHVLQADPDKLTTSAET